MNDNRTTKVMCGTEYVASWKSSICIKQSSCWFKLQDWGTSTWFQKGLKGSSFWLTVFCKSCHTELFYLMCPWQVLYVTEHTNVRAIRRFLIPKLSSKLPLHTTHKVLRLMSHCRDLAGLFLLPSYTPSRGSWTEVMTWHQQPCESYDKERTVCAVKYIPIWWFFGKIFVRKLHIEFLLLLPLSADCRPLLLPAVGHSRGRENTIIFALHNDNSATLSCRKYCMHPPSPTCE